MKKSNLKRIKIGLVVFSLTMLGTVSVQGKPHEIKPIFIQAHTNNLPHMDLDMTGPEYQRLLNQLFSFEGFDQELANELQPIFEAGKRNLDWLKFINNHRPAGQKISLSSKETQQASPIEEPRRYNPTIILDKFHDLMGQLPQSIKAVVIDGAPMTINPPMPDKEYMEWGLKIDRSYQLAARWMTMAPWLNELEQRRLLDIRGYYYFSKEENLAARLTNWLQLDFDTQTRFYGFLVGMCLNNSDFNTPVNTSERDCKTHLGQAITSAKVNEFYMQNLEGAKALYDSYFLIPVSRSDVKWNQNLEEMHVPFIDPKTDALRHFLADNIQDEFKWNNWHLLLDFLPNGLNTPHLEFQAGATPHVNAIAGDIITMDANAPLTEYDIQWTIRHEFGHVIGFPDCYVEFYNRQENVITSYQLDITNLMCSRRGQMQERHYTELKRVYGSN